MRIKHCESSQTVCSCEATQSGDCFTLCKIWMGPRIAAHSAAEKNKNYIFGLFYCYHLELVLAWLPAGKKISAVQHLKARSRVLRPYDNMTASEKKKTFYSSRVQQRNLTKFSTWDCRQLACSGCLQRCSDFLERRRCDGNPINILLRGANLKSQFVKTEAPPRNPSWRVKDKMTASGDSHDQRTTIFTIAVPMRLKLYERRATVKLHYPLRLTCHFPHTGLFEWRELKTCHLKKKKPGWHFPGANEEKPKSTSRDVIWFLAGCQAMSQVVLKDESGEGDHLPCVNNTTGPSGYRPENSGGVKKKKKEKRKTDTANDTATVSPCLLTKREFKQNQTCHSTKAISESGAGKI